MSNLNRIERDANENLQIVRWDLRVPDTPGSYRVYPYCDREVDISGAERDNNIFQQPQDVIRRRMAGFALEAARIVLEEG